jgi:hypothetical protein
MVKMVVGGMADWWRGGSVTLTDRDRDGKQQSHMVWFRFTPFFSLFTLLSLSL